MNERGQIFTLDMFFALTLTVILVSYSGLALEGARRQAEGYSLRYSLERTVNDAADVLVKSAGTPIDWNEDVGNLGTIGLADVSEGVPIQNTLDAGKLGWIRELCRANNWDPTKSEVQAIMALFGGSGNFEVKATDRGSLARVSEDFTINTTLFGVEVEVKVDFKTDKINVEVKLKWDGHESVKVKEASDFVLVVEGGGLTVEVVAKARVVEIWYETILWDIWPGWDVEDSSGAENSLEVAVVRRSIAMRGFGDVRSEARALKHVPGGGQEWSDYYLYFDVYPGELDAFDWYIVLKPSSKNKPETKIFVNRNPSQNYDYKFPPEDDTIFIPRKSGIDDPTVINPLHEEPTQNYLGVRIKGSKDEWVDIYVIAVPTGLPLESEQVVLDWIPVKLEVKLWR